MKTRLIHPLWTHFPAAAALVIFIVYMLAGGNLPESVPVHFGNNGMPDSYGSPWLVGGLTIGLSLLFMGISILLDELWARQEKKKTFNWLSLMDEITVGAMVGINLGYLAFLHENEALFRHDWSYLGLVGGGAVVLAVLLEILRPYRPYAGQIEEKESHITKTEIERCLKENITFVYWDYQNPWYVTLLTVLLPLTFLVSGALMWFEMPWLSVMFFFIALSSIVLYGGQRVMVNREEIIIRWGILGFKVLKLNVEEINQVEKHEFAPLRDFGGYGIRFNREMTAYYLRGSRGVKLTTRNGKKYLIGSDTVDNLAAVIGAVSQQSKYDHA